MTADIAIAIGIDASDVAYTLQIQNLTKYREALLAHGVTEEQITREIEAYNIRRMQSGTSWTDGMEGALLQYQRDASNYSALAARATTSSLSAMENGLVAFSTRTQTASQAVKSMVGTMLTELARLQAQAVMAPFTRGLSGLFSNMFGAGPSSDQLQSDYAGFYRQAYAPVQVESLAPLPKANALGGAYSSPGLSAYSSQIVDRPTYFAFASGGVPNYGVMGEAGEEGILPLRRDSSGRLGVMASMGQEPGPRLSARAEQGGGSGQVNQTISVTLHQQPGEDQDALLARLQAQLFPQMAAIADAKATNAIGQLIKKVNEGGNMAKTFGRR